MEAKANSQIDDLACLFFKEFARFEYALKAAAYHHGERDVKPDWVAFEKSQPVVSYFNKQHPGILGEAIRYLLEQPPKKQSIVENKLRWRQCKKSGKVSEQLGSYVCRVRNNLFHGGKSNEDWFDSQRCELLMRHSLIVIRAFLDASPEVAQAHHGLS